MNFRCDHRLHTSRQQCHAPVPDPFRRKDRGPFARRDRMHPSGSEGQQGTDPRRQPSRQRAEPRSDPGHEPEPSRMGKDPQQHRPQPPVGQRTAIGALDMPPRVVDQMHVVHPGRTGGHAGVAGQAAVDMAHRIPVRRPTGLQHALDQIDPAAGRIALVPKQQIGRAGGVAEAAMHAASRDRLGMGSIRVAPDLRSKLRPHRQPPIRPGLRIPSGSKRSRNRALTCARGSNSGGKGSTASRTGRLARNSSATPPHSAAALRISAPPASSPSSATRTHTDAPP